MDMVLRRIKYALEDVWDKVAKFFCTVAFFLLSVLAVFAVLSPIIVPIVVGYAVFVAVSSGLDPIVKGIIFAVYSFGLFIYGGYLGLRGCNDVKKEVRDGLDMCEKKVLSILDDAKRCRSARSSIENKVYDFMTCVDAVKKKL